MSVLTVYRSPRMVVMEMDEVFAQALSENLAGITQTAISGQFGQFEVEIPMRIDGEQVPARLRLRVTASN